MTHLLDTNAWIMDLRQKNAIFLQKSRQHASSDLALCSVVVGELLYGAYHGSSSHLAANLSLIAQLRNKHQSLPFDDSAAEEYGKVRQHLATLGTPISANDLMIASIARDHNLILVTHNTAEFSRVPGLKIEDWQTP